MARTVAFPLVAEDLADMQRTLIRRALLRRRFAVRMGGLLVAAFAFGIAVALTIGDPLFWAVVMAAGGVGWGTLVLAAIIGLIYALVPRRAARTYAQQRSLHGVITFDWDAEGFALTTRYGTTRYPWADMIAWTNGHRCVIVLASDVIGYLVPMRALAPDALGDLWATLPDSGLPRR